MDLEYWIDYVNKFDVGHLIPLYDKMGLVYNHVFTFFKILI